MAELLSPKKKDISELFSSEFQQMTKNEISLGQLEKTKDKLVQLIYSNLTENERQFLLSFKNLEPKRNLIRVNNTDVISNLHSVQSKLYNLKRMDEAKRKEALIKLDNILYRKTV